MLRPEQLSGCWTAVITPFLEDESLDLPGLEKNLQFQMQSGIAGVVPVGTTGESPTLSESEHNIIVTRTVDHLNYLKVRGHGNLLCIAGCGSNSTDNALSFVDYASKIGCDGVLLVDPYYNGPSSAEIRDYYYDPIAKRHPDMAIVPYIIPGRTGCALLPEDLAILNLRHPNIMAVKEASADTLRMARTRSLLPTPFRILSGDDSMTWHMICTSDIKADGVISVMANIAPKAISTMCGLLLDGSIEEARRIIRALDPLFEAVTVSTERETRGVMVVDKFRNPVPIKTMMQGLGIPAGPCRPPLGRMSPEGVEIVHQALRDCWERDTWVLRPIEDFYGVDIVGRLSDDKAWQALAS